MRRSGYVDALGRTWTAKSLDALLADPAVRLTVEQGAQIGMFNPGTRMSPGAVFAWARDRYTREEPAALLLLLVARFFDRGGKPGLGRIEA